jgi:hypothetical protein
MDVLVLRFCFREDVFTESLTSNGYTRYITFASRKTGEFLDQLNDYQALN